MTRRWGVGQGVGQAASAGARPSAALATSWDNGMIGMIGRVPHDSGLPVAAGPPAATGRYSDADSARRLRKARTAGSSLSSSAAV